MGQFKTLAVALAAVGLVACASESTAPPPPTPTLNPQGFEFDADGWVTTQGITRVASGGGSLHLTASSGGYYAELQNKLDEYQAPGYGDAGFSRFGGYGAEYKGDFYQAIDVFVDPTWGPAGGAFWIDMSPNRVDRNNWGAEHNFHLTGTGSEVEVSVDQAGTIATITTAGWYTFLMTFEKGAAATDPVVTRMAVLDSDNVAFGAATVLATSPGGPLTSQDLLGNGYVWITVWTNGFAGDAVAIDNVRTGLLPYR